MNAGASVPGGAAHVAPGARLGRDVTVGAGSVIHDCAVLGDRTQVMELCVIGAAAAQAAAECRVGTDALIRSHAVVYAGAELGPALETGHHVVIREGTRAGENLRVGNFSDIEGDCTIGDFCRLHGYVHVGKGSEIGHFVWIFSLVTLTNDPLPPSLEHAPVRIGDGAVICVGATLMPGVTIGKGAYISAGARVESDVPPGGVLGPDGRLVGHVSSLMRLDSGLRHPWMSHAQSLFPSRAHDRITALRDEVLASRKLWS